MQRCSEVGEAGSVQRVSKEDLFRQSDFLSIHTVQSSRTIGMTAQKPTD
jgi:phosphoglycerate dehydrogenase-like enzyme